MSDLHQVQLLLSKSYKDALLETGFEKFVSDGLPALKKILQKLLSDVVPSSENDPSTLRQSRIASAMFAYTAELHHVVGSFIGKTPSHGAISRNLRALKISEAHIQITILLESYRLERDFDLKVECSIPDTQLNDLRRLVSPNGSNPFVHKETKESESLLTYLQHIVEYLCIQDSIPFMAGDSSTAKSVSLPDAISILKGEFYSCVPREIWTIISDSIGEDETMDVSSPVSFSKKPQPDILTKGVGMRGKKLPTSAKKMKLTKGSADSNAVACKFMNIKALARRVVNTNSFTRPSAGKKSASGVTETRTEVLKELESLNGGGVKKSSSRRALDELKLQKGLQALKELDNYNFNGIAKKSSSRSLKEGIKKEKKESKDLNNIRKHPLKHAMDEEREKLKKSLALTVRLRGPAVYQQRRTTQPPGITITSSDDSGRNEVNIIFCSTV
ncbi:hypothetical protein HDU67_006279 [Dinochytrium kinnereticum]|nr:hypothetical protein HDU67_006279 [Dinochytrium kinnereticum]